MCIRDSLCGLNTALAVTLMHKDFLNKLIEHGNRQPVSYTHLDVYKRQGYLFSNAFEKSILYIQRKVNQGGPVP